MHGCARKTITSIHHIVRGALPALQLPMVLIYVCNEWESVHVWFEFTFFSKLISKARNPTTVIKVSQFINRVLFLLWFIRFEKKYVCYYFFKLHKSHDNTRFTNWVTISISIHSKQSEFLRYVLPFHLPTLNQLTCVNQEIQNRLSNFWSSALNIFSILWNI